MTRNRCHGFFRARTAASGPHNLTQKPESTIMSSKTNDASSDFPAANPHIKTVTCGNVMLSIFANEGQRDGSATVYYTVKVSRSYRDADGSWKYANGFYKSHLPQVIYACQRALEFIEAAETQPPF